MNNSCNVITIRLNIAALEILDTLLLLAVMSKKIKNTKKKTLKIHPKNHTRKTGNIHKDFEQDEVFIPNCSGIPILFYPN